MERRMEFCMHIQTSLTLQTRSSMFIFRCASCTFNKSGGNLLHILSKPFSKRVFRINTIVMILVYYYHDAFHEANEGSAKTCPFNLIFFNLRPLERHSFRVLVSGLAKAFYFQLLNCDIEIIQ